MNEKVIKVLEYNKIIEKLKDSASSALGKGLAEQLKPFTSYEEVIPAQNQTTDAVTCVLRKGTPPLGGIHEVRSFIRRAQSSGMLNPGELLMIADVLRASRKLKGYITQNKITVHETISR